MVEAKNVLVLVGVLLYVLLIPIALVRGSVGFIPDVTLFLVIPLLFNWWYDLMKLTPVSYSLLVLAPLPHALGIFGWYFKSPLPIAWDHITHLAGLFPLAFAFTVCFAQWSDKQVFTKKNALLVASVFLLVSGVGAIIELSEFVGFLTLGFGEGGFRFGPGDGLEGDQAVKDIGGGWMNTGWDLIYNTIAVVAGMVVGLGVVIRKKISRNIS